MRLTSSVSGLPPACAKHVFRSCTNFSMGFIGLAVSEVMVFLAPTRRLERVFCETSAWCRCFVVNPSGKNALEPMNVRQSDEITIICRQQRSHLIIWEFHRSSTKDLSSARYISYHPSCLQLLLFFLETRLRQRSFSAKSLIPASNRRAITRRFALSAAWRPHLRTRWRIRWSLASGSAAN